MDNSVENPEELASWDDRAEWIIEPFLSERMGRPVSVTVKRPCIHKLIWLGTYFKIAAFAMVYSQGPEGELEATVIPFSAIAHDTDLLDEQSKKELLEFKK